MKLFLFIFQILLFTGCKLKPIETDPCDFSNNRDVSFSKEVMPLLKSKCLQCHDSKNHYDGIILESYTQVKQNSQTGEVYESVVSINGASSPRMPKGGQLNDCEVNILKIWIQQGMMNN